MNRRGLGEVEKYLSHKYQFCVNPKRNKSKNYLYYIPSIIKIINIMGYFINLLVVLWIRLFSGRVFVRKSSGIAQLRRYYPISNRLIFFYWFQSVDQWLRNDVISWIICDWLTELRSRLDFAISNLIVSTVVFSALWIISWMYRVYICSTNSQFFNSVFVFAWFKYWNP